MVCVLRSVSFLIATSGYFMHQASVNTVTCTRYGKDSELLGGSLLLVSLLRRRNFLVPQILLVAIAINFGTGI